jgi:hypothetical protein
VNEAGQAKATARPSAELDTGGAPPWASAIAVPVRVASQPPPVHLRAGGRGTRRVPACQCGWTFYATVRTLRIADRTHGIHLDRVHSGRVSADR